jgi:membrane associated rhomboid family serine protease
MIQAPVGFQCPECVKGNSQEVRTMRTLQGSADAVVTKALVAVNAVVFLYGISGGGNVMSRASNRLALDYALHGPSVESGEWYRLVTSGFLHFGLMHVFFNMFLLWQLGAVLEHAFGRARFGGLYVASLLGGSLGALLLSPDALTAGASGAVYGLMGATVVVARSRGIGFMQSGVGGLLAINLLLTFAIPGISIGGHVGGLIAGAIAGLMIGGTDRQPVQVGAVAVGSLALALLGAGIAVA